MTLRLHSICEVYNANGLTVRLEVTQGRASWTAVNSFGRNVFCGVSVSRRSALIQIRKQVGQDIKLIGMTGTKLNRKVV